MPSRLEYPSVLKHAGIAQLVEHNLAKVGVASSNLVSRSNFSLKPCQTGFFRFYSRAETLYRRTTPPGQGIQARQIKQAEWQNGYAADCKSVYLGSTPGSASKF